MGISKKDTRKNERNENAILTFGSHSAPIISVVRITLFLAIRRHVDSAEETAVCLGDGREILLGVE
jgi:hypothetical protein